jgi:hypothetical protein
MPVTVRFEWNGQTYKRKYEAASFAAMDDTNRAAAEYARSIVWVDTGQARDSIDYTPAARNGRKITGSFGSDGSAPHFIYINNGTRYITGGRFLERAADAVLPSFPGRLQARAF